MQHTVTTTCIMQNQGLSVCEEEILLGAKNSTQEEEDVTQILQTRRSNTTVFPHIPKVLLDWHLETVEAISAQWTVNQLVMILGFALQFTVLLNCGHKGTDMVSNNCHTVVFMQHCATCAKTKKILHIFRPPAARSNKAKRIHVFTVFLPNFH